MVEDSSLEKNRVFYDALYVLFRWKGRLAAFCGLLFVLVLFFTFLSTPKYKMTTKVLIRSNPQQQLILFKDLATPGRESPVVNPARSLMQILKGREMAREVVERFALDERLKADREQPKTFRGRIKQTISDTLKAVGGFIARILGRESVSPNYAAKAIERFMNEAQDIHLEEESHVISVTIWDKNPQMAADIANFMVERLMTRSAELEQINARQAYAFTKQQVEEAKEELEKSETELSAFRDANQIISLAEQKEAMFDELHDLKSRRLAVQVELSEAKAKLAEMQQTISEQREVLARVPIFSNNPVIKDLIRSLNAGEIELAEALERFTELSEDVRTLKAKTTESRKKLEEELDAVMKSDMAVLQSIHPDLASEYAKLKGNLSALEAKNASLKEEIETLTEEVAALTAIETRLEALERQRDTNERLYMNLADKLSELKVQRVFEISGYDLKIIDRAVAEENTGPDRPRWLLVIPVAFIGSLLISFGLVFFIEYWNESFKSPQEIERKLELDVLCTVPDVPGKL